MNRRDRERRVFGELATYEISDHVHAHEQLALMHPHEAHVANVVAGAW